MKKIVSVLLVLMCAAFAFSASYTNNTYQKLADQYTRQAQNAFNAGEYTKAIEYSRLAEENAALSREYIDKMTVRQRAEMVLSQANTRIGWAKSIGSDENYPIAISTAESAYESAKNAFDSEDYESTIRWAQEALAALDGVREIGVLPEYYVVRPWADTRDCYWNISGRPYVYNNPWLWENLYQNPENKNQMPEPSNPNLIHPGMKMKIPSLTGEKRSGVYSPSVNYDPYNAHR